MKDKVKAQDLLKEAISAGIPDVTDLNLATYHLCDLLIEEFRVYGDQEAYTEAINLLDQLVNRSTKQNNVFFQVEAMTLQSKFSMIDGELEAAGKYLEQAVEVAANKQISSLTKRVNDERDHFLNEINKWRLLNSENISTFEKLGKTEIQSYIAKALDIIEKS